VASGDLRTGEKLPSRGEIARRFDIHANTISNAYQELAENGLIEFRPGSGFYVCEQKPENTDSENSLESLTANFLNNARSFGFSPEEIQESLQKHFEAETPKHFLVIETVEGLREILIEEIKRATNAKTLGIGFEQFQFEPEKMDGIFVALSDEEPRIESILPPEKTCLYLKTNSVAEAMEGETRPSEDSLIALVSGWNTFLMMAKTILVAAQVENDSIITRLTSLENWSRGLDNASMIICDSLTAQKFPNDKRVRPFRLISEASIEELKLIRNKK
jgi:DNA-binding transcriptional regulator YhcF (GntR family)